MYCGLLLIRSQKTGKRFLFVKFPTLVGKSLIIMKTWQVNLRGGLINVVPANLSEALPLIRVHLETFCSLWMPCCFIITSRKPLIQSSYKHQKRNFQLDQNRNALKWNLYFCRLSQPTSFTSNPKTGRLISSEVLKVLFRKPEAGNILPEKKIIAKLIINTSTALLDFFISCFSSLKIPQTGMIFQGK